MKKRLLAFLSILCLLSGLWAGASVAIAEEPVTLTIFIDHSWYPVEAFTGIIPEEITRLTGVKLEPTVAIDGNQLGVMLASGELPDLVYTQNMVDRMSDPAVAYDYEELIAKYGVDWKLSEKQLGIARGLSEDGKAYTVLNHYSEKKDWEGSNAVPMAGSLLYREDLLTAMGEKAPTSFDELFALFGKVKAAYPDVTPLKFNENWNALTFRYLNGMGNLEFIEQTDGTYIHYSQDPRYHALLLWLNECFRAGYIIADDPYFVKGSTAIADDKYFASAGCTQNHIPGANATLAKINPDYYLVEMVPFAESDYKTSDTGWSGTFITKNCENPEAAIKLLAWMFTPEAQALTQMGREGIEYTLNEQGLPVFSEEWKQAIADATQNTIYNTWFYLGGSEIVEANSRCATTDPALIAQTYKIIRDRFDNYPWVQAAMPKSESDERIIYNKINELRKTYEAKVILAASPEEAEAVYQEYLANADKIGIKDLNTFMTENIAKVIVLYK